MPASKIIGISGFAGSGKSTVAGMIPGAVQMSFADPLKYFCKEIFDFTDAQLWGPSECRNGWDPRYMRADGQPLTPRYALQTLGTEWGRNCYPDIWVNYAMRRAREAIEEGAPAVVFADCRFINEARAIRAADGEVWQVRRPSVGAQAPHPSEMEQTSTTFLDVVRVIIDNNESIERLREVVLSAAEIAGIQTDSDSRCAECQSNYHEGFTCPHPPSYWRFHAAR